VATSATGLVDACQTHAADHTDMHLHVDVCYISTCNSFRASVQGIALRQTI